MISWIVFIILFRINLSTQKSHQSFKCNDYMLEQTHFHPSGVSFKSGPHYICHLENIEGEPGVAEVVNELLVAADGPFKGKFGLIEPVEVGAIECKKVSFERIPRILFNKFPKLLVLNASDVNLMEIETDDFMHAENLNILILSRNHISHLENGIFSEMKKLRKIDLSRNEIEYINQGTFFGCSENLYEVDMSHNIIKELDFSSLTPLAHPKKLSVELKLDDNEISCVKETFSLSHLVFESLSLRNNKISAFSCPDMRIDELHLEDNGLQTISFDNCSVEYAVLSKNHLSYLHIHGDMRGLVAEGNLIDSFIVSGEPQMYHMDLSGNGEIENILPTLKLMSSLQYLNLSNSHLGALHEDTFASMGDLKYLYLKNCSINIIPYGTFEANKHLITLDLSENDLETIDLETMFEGLDNLKTLDLSGNKLRQIEGIEKIREVLPELKEIGIDGNRWTCLPSTIKNLKHKHIAITEIKDVVAHSESAAGIRCPRE